MAPAPAASRPSLLRLVASALSQRMVGWSAGLPNGGLPSTESQDGMLNKKGMNASGVIPLRGESPGIYQPTGTTVRIRGWEQHPVVSACIREIVNLSAAVPLECYRNVPNPNGADDIVVLGSKFAGNQLVSTPSPLLSSMRLRQLTMVHWLVYGNAFWFLERPRPDAQPTSIRVVHPEDIYSVYVNNAGYPIWYMWRDVLGYPHTSPVTDIVHFRDLAAKGLVFGYPRAASALNDIIGDTEASQYVREVVTNHGSPMGFALVHEGTTQDEATVAEAHLHNKLVERGQRGRFLFMGGVTDVKSLAFDLRELEFPDLRRVSREDICAAIGVDPRMVGITSASKDSGLSGNQYTEARRRLVAQTVEPMMRAMESELNMWLAPEFGDVYMRFNPDSLRALIEDDTETTNRITSEVTAGLITVQEARVALDRPAEYPTGDLLAIPSALQLIPATLAGTTPPTDANANAISAGTSSGGGAPAAAPEKPLANDAGLDPNRPNDPPKVTDGTAIPAPKRTALTDGILHVAKPPKFVFRSNSAVQTRGIVLSKEQRNMLWNQFDQRAVREEAPFKRTALVLFSEERHAVNRVFDALDASNPDAPVDVQGQQAKKQLQQMYKPGGPLEQRWKDRFHPLVGEVYAKGAEHIDSAVKRSTPDVTDTGVQDIDISFHLSDPNVLQAIMDRVKRLASQVGQTTADQISTALEIGIREGMAMREIAKLIDQTVFGSSASYRAMMIARTETIGALNQGQFDAAMGNDNVSYKEWLTQGDALVRDTHAECESEGAIPIDEIFSNGLLHPGADGAPADEVINCRCSLLYYDSDPNDTRSKRFNPYHDATNGQFASGGGGGGGGTATDDKGSATSGEEWKAGIKAHAKLATDAHHAHDSLVTNGGFTLHDDLTPDGAKGYFVSMAGHEQQVGIRDANGWAILDYRDEKLPLLQKDPSLRIGGWYNPEDKKVYLDLSKRFDSKDAAIEFGKKHQQIAGYDSHKGETFDIGGRRSVHSPLGLTVEQEHARLTSMYENPVNAPTLRLAPTTADADAMAAAAKKTTKSARFNPWHDATNGQFSSGGSGGGVGSGSHNGDSAVEAPAPKTHYMPAGKKNIGKTAKELGWPKEYKGTDISHQRIQTEYDAPDVLAARARVAAMTPTDALKGRESIQKTALEKAYGDGAPTKGRVADIVIGGPGSGKSSRVAEPIAHDHGSLIIDSDIVKKYLPENEGGLGAPRVHNESTMIAEGPLLARAISNGDNIVIPKVGKNAGTITQISNELHAHGYEVNLHYVDVSTPTQVERTLSRFRTEGRFVDPKYVLTVNGNPGKTFENIKANPTFKHVDFYDNNGSHLVIHKFRSSPADARSLVTRDGKQPSFTQLMDAAAKHLPQDPAVLGYVEDPDADAMCLATLKLIPTTPPGKPKTT